MVPELQSHLGFQATKNSDSKEFSSGSEILKAKTMRHRPGALEFHSDPPIPHFLRLSHSLRAQFLSRSLPHSQPPSFPLCLSPTLNPPQSLVPLCLSPTLNPHSLYFSGFGFAEEVVGVDFGCGGRRAAKLEKTVWRSAFVRRAYDDFGCQI
uniref:Uncharacterized protein n=1 Tax=Fagus sylvatica TaxID=28930 RepID=A0A2N9HVV7_FAGSY